MDVRLLTMNDFDTPDWSEFMTESKRTIYRKRFLNPKAKAYGVFINGHLAYSTWILYEEVTYSEAYTLLKDSSCALLLDSYCHPDFRGNGLHNFMNQWCLEEMQRNGVKKAYVIILAYNTPALKTQKKCGLTVERTFYSYTFRNKFTVKF